MLAISKLYHTPTDNLQPAYTGAATGPSGGFFFAKMKESKPSSTVAPPSYTSTESSPAAPGLVDHPQTVVQEEREVSSASSEEIERLRNFLVFVLACDYKRKLEASLSSADWEHYANINTVLDKLEKSSRHTDLTATERATLAPYFWKYLDEPCKALGVPMEYVCRVIIRFFQYQTFHGQYKGAVFGLLRSNGMSVLARKFYLDRTIVIPRIATCRTTRERLLAGVENISRLYFDSINGIECSMSASQDDIVGTVTQSISYALNERGRAYESRREEGKTTVNELNTLSLQHWGFRIQTCWASVSKRQSVFPDTTRKLGREELEEKQKALRKRRWTQWPYNWTVTSGQFLPDFFEDRTLEDASEA